MNFKHTINYDDDKKYNVSYIYKCIDLILNVFDYKLMLMIDVENKKILKRRIIKK